MAQSLDEVYQGLQARHIRLLLIKPALPDENIECSLTVVHIDQAPRLDALSYVWGPGTPTEEIYCNGTTMCIRKNLADALRNLRSLPTFRNANEEQHWASIAEVWGKDHVLHSSDNCWKKFSRNRHEHTDPTYPLDSLVWIDAICINQNDTNERANQVRLVTEIYTSARMVKLWLGNEDSWPMPHTVETKRDSELDDPLWSFIALHGLPSTESKDWDALRQFFDDPYFQRVWVVQEIVLAQKAVVFVGDWEIEWSAVWFQKHGYLSPLSISQGPKEWQGSIPISNAAELILHDLRRRKATQKLDKVYAAYGLAQETCRFSQTGYHPLTQISYDSGARTVYRNIARFLIIGNGNLAVLSHAGSFRGPAPGWLSWVPDWSRRKANIQLIDVDGAEPLYNSSQSQPLTIGYTADQDILPLEGIECDKITAYSTRLLDRDPGESTVREEQKFALSAWRLIISRPPAHNRFDQTETARRRPLGSFAATLSAGLVDDRSPFLNDTGYSRDAERWLTSYLETGVTRSTLLAKHFALQGLPALRGLAEDASTALEPRRFHRKMVHICRGRRIFVTKDGLFGIDPENMKENDIVVVFFGAKVPFVLRPVGEEYQLIGEFYCVQLIEGEAIEKLNKGRLKTRFFDLR
ncbi:hypothetical protein TruAng_006383 [Truncatella angustata]|nr:hypothetical protein TruAng_006383 [Truncatella angustata]